MSGGKAPRDRGRRAENAVVHWLRERLPWSKTIERRDEGAHDRFGDINGLPGVVVEVKDWGKMQLGTWVDQMLEACAETNALTGVVLHKRKGTADRCGEWFATMTANQWLVLMAEADYLPPAFTLTGDGNTEFVPLPTTSAQTVGTLAAEIVDL